MDTERKISQFTYHINNGNEAIQAEHINDLGKSVNNLEKNVVEISDDNFESKALFALEHNLFANSIFIDEMKNPYKIFQAKSTNILYDEKSSCIYLGNTGNEGIAQSIFFVPDDDCPIDQVTLVAEEYIPRGAKIEYFLSIDGQSFFPVKNGQSDLVQMPVKGTGVFIKARLVKNNFGETPKIYGWAALYRDTIIEKLMGLDNIDLSRFSASQVGDTILIRDRKQDDKVVLIIDPNGATQLIFDTTNDRLDRIIETQFDLTIEEKMNYGQYYNSKGTYEEVLLGTTRKIIQEEAATGTIPVDIIKKINDMFNSTGGTANDINDTTGGA